MVCLEDITKNFNGKKAVQSLSFCVGQGEILGLIGINGSGKTTTLKMIVGLLQPDFGQINVHDVNRLQEPERARRLIGYAPEAPYLYDFLTGLDYLQFVGQVRGLPEKKSIQMAEELLDFFQLLGAKKELIRNYSYGMKKKISVASALVGAPPVLILDEPTEGLDIFSVERLNQKLQMLRSEGKTILVASHSTAFLAEISDRMAILHEGRLIKMVELSSLPAEDRTKSIEKIYKNATEAELKS